MLDPKEAMPDIAPDTEDQLLTRHVLGEQIKAKIVSLDPTRMSFASRGRVTIYVSTGDGDNVSYELRIKSIPAYKLQEIMGQYGANAPQLQYRINPETGESEVDETNPETLAAYFHFASAQTSIRYQKILYGLDLEAMGMDIKSSDGQNRIVWSKDGTVKNEEEAIETLKMLGFTPIHLAQIDEAIDALSAQASGENLDMEKEKKI